MKLRKHRTDRDYFLELWGKWYDTGGRLSLGDAADLKHIYSWVCRGKRDLAEIKAEEVSEAEYHRSVAQQIDRESKRRSGNN